MKITPIKKVFFSNQLTKNSLFHSQLNESCHAILHCGSMFIQTKISSESGSNLIYTHVLHNKRTIQKRKCNTLKFAIDTAN